MSVLNLIRLMIFKERKHSSNDDFQNAIYQYDRRVWKIQSKLESRMTGNIFEIIFHRIIIRFVEFDVIEKSNDYLSK